MDNSQYVDLMGKSVKFTAIRAYFPQKFSPYVYIATTPMSLILCGESDHFLNPPVRLPNIAMRDLIFPLRCVERTLINDNESKGGGWGSAREQFERAKT